MKKTALLVTAAAITLMAGAAQAQTSPWYAGIAAGNGKGSNISESEVNDSLRGLGYANPVTASDRKDSVYRLTLGYQLNPSVAFEALYTDLGSYSTRSTVTTGGVNANYKSSGFGVGAVLSAPISQQLSVFGRLGVLSAKTEANFSSSGNVSLLFNQGSKTKVGHYLGVGLQYDLMPNLALRAEYEKFAKLGDDSTGGELKVDTYTVGAIFRF